MNKYSLLDKIAAFLRLIRWKNLVIIVLTLSSIYLKITWGNSLHGLIFIYLLAIVCVMGAANVINDIYDYKIDLINKPDRVIVGKVISVKLAVVIYVSLNIFALVITQRWLFFAYCFSTIAALWLYSYKLKSLPLIGNFVISLLTFCSILIINQVSLQYAATDVVDVVLPVAGLAFFIQFLREVVKDVEDIKGDKEQGCRTFPVLFGEQKTKLLVYIVATLFVITMLYWQWTLQKHIWSLYAMYYLLAVFVVKMYRASHKSHYTFLSGLLKMMMLVGLSSIIFV